MGFFQFLKKLHAFVPGFRQLSARSMAIASTYYIVAVVALLTVWYWGLLMLALPFLLFNLLDLNAGRGKALPLALACAAGFAVLLGTAGALSTGSLQRGTPLLAATGSKIASGTKYTAATSAAVVTTAAPKKTDRSSLTALPGATAQPASTARATASAGTDRAQYAYCSAKTGKVFHLPGCASAKRIKPENLIGYSTKEEALAAGLQPCKKCKP